MKMSKEVQDWVLFECLMYRYTRKAKLSMILSELREIGDIDEALVMDTWVDVLVTKITLNLE
jgi:hypothetical protein